jgi:hypothetical protein
MVYSKGLNRPQCPCPPPFAPPVEVDERLNLATRSLCLYQLGNQYRKAAVPTGRCTTQNTEGTPRRAAGASLGGSARWMSSVMAGSSPVTPRIVARAQSASTGAIRPSWRPRSPLRPRCRRTSRAFRLRSGEAEGHARDIVHQGARRLQHMRNLGAERFSRRVARSRYLHAMRRSHGGKTSGSQRRGRAQGWWQFARQPAEPADDPCRRGPPHFVLEDRRDGFLLNPAPLSAVPSSMVFP